MSVLVAKVAAAALAVLLSATTGLAPAFLTARNVSCLRSADKNRLLGVLLNVGGAVLVTNCFCHWLPEVRHGIELANVTESVVPLAETLMCTGFFLTCLVDMLLSRVLSVRLRLCSSAETEAETDSGAGDSGVRTVFVLSALSLHSVVEGMALGLETQTSGVWMNFGALATHKTVIALSLGAELVSAAVTNLRLLLSIAAFSLSTAVGVGIGIVISGIHRNVQGDLKLQIIQGAATGTIVYVVFFEIFPNARQFAGAGLGRAFAMMAGFLTFFPSLLFHIEGRSGTAAGESDKQY